MAGNYSIRAIETKFRSYVFRSRLEAKWAAMFEMLGWRWDYEPVNFNGWVPDFVIYGHKTVYVEVKPTIVFLPEIGDKMLASGCEEEMLLVGQYPCLHDELCDSVGIGWNAEPDIPEMQGYRAFDDALWQKWDHGYGFGSESQSWRCRITGQHVSSPHGLYEVNENEIRDLWANAANATRFQTYRS